MKRYIVLADCESCGHMHRVYDRAANCYYRFENRDIPAVIASTTENLHPLWIDKQLSKIGPEKLKAILEA